MQQTHQIRITFPVYKTRYEKRYYFSETLQLENILPLQSDYICQVI